MADNAAITAGPEPPAPGSPSRKTAAIADVPRLGLTRAEAAASIGVSLDTFEKKIQPHLRLVRTGRRIIVPVSVLERYLERHAAMELRG
jgi:excisionase family DNA binding protein